jgi:hypothetical protein
MGLSFSTHSRILFSSEYFHYKIFIHEKCLENQNYKFSRPGIIDARARYRAAARRLRNTALDEEEGAERKGEGALYTQHGLRKKSKENLSLFTKN